MTAGFGVAGLLVVLAFVPVVRDPPGADGPDGDPQPVAGAELATPAASR